MQLSDCHAEQLHLFKCRGALWPIHTSSSQRSFTPVPTMLPLGLGIFQARGLVSSGEASHSSESDGPEASEYSDIDPFTDDEGNQPIERPHCSGNQQTPFVPHCPQGFLSPDLDSLIGGHVMISSLFFKYCPTWRVFQTCSCNGRLRET
jgi:hypothetical protein